MDPNVLINGLLQYLSLVILLTFHEYGHAWMALKCGDSTARDEGRCSINPLVHMDPIGTGLIPLLQIFSPTVGAFLLGWAKPVPVNINNLRHPKRDDILVSMAGPAMNVLLAIGLVLLARAGDIAGQESAVNVFISMAHLSLLLCFFNLLPIPPLDGSHVVRVLINMDYYTYMQIAQYGFILIIVILNFVPFIGQFIGLLSFGTLMLLARIIGLG